MTRMKSTYEPYVFILYRKSGNKMRKLQTVRCRLREAELEALDLASELDTVIILSWQDPETTEWHIFARYLPDGRRRLHGETYYERLSVIKHPAFGRCWFRVKEEEGGAL